MSSHPVPTHRDAFGEVGLAPQLADAVVDAIWLGQAQFRGYFHGGRCPSTPATARSWLLGRPVPSSCEGCYDLYSMTVAESCTAKPGPRAADGSSKRDKIAAADNPGGYARRLGQSAATDGLRAQSVRLHGVAKADAAGGVAGRVRAALADSWLEELFVLMRRAVSEPKPVSREFWPYERFADALAARAAISTQDAAEAVRRDVRRITDVIIRVAGAEWHHNHFTAPRLARGARSAVSILDENGYTYDVPASQPGDEELAGTAVRVLFVEQLAAGVPSREAMRRAVDELADAPSSGSDSQLDELCVLYLAEIVVSAVTASPRPATAPSNGLVALGQGRATVSHVRAVVRAHLGADSVVLERGLVARVLARAARELR